MPCHNLIFNRSRLCYCGFWVCHKTAHSCFRQHALWLHLPTTLPSITLETTLTTNLAHSLRSPLRAIAPDRKGVHFFSDRVFANRHPSMVKRTHQKEQRSYIYIYIYTPVYWIFTARELTGQPTIAHGLFVRPQRGSRPQIKTRTSQIVIVPTGCSDHRRGASDSWRSLRSHPNEQIKRNIPCELKRKGEDLKVFDRIRRRIRSKFDRLFKNGITLKGSESFRLGPRSTERRASSGA